MAHPYYHAVSAAKRFGGRPEDYLAIESWLDATKQSWADMRHRAVLHSTFGIFLAEEHFGVTITNADGTPVPVRLIGELHVREDLGFIPTLQDWLGALPLKPWMLRGARKLSRELTEPDPAAFTPETGV